MKILLVNNHTQHLQKLSAALAGHDVEMQIYQPGLDFHERGKDLIILSGGGGEGLEIDDQHQRGRLWYDDQMKFVLSTKKPVIGICMGFEVICRAFGSPIPKMSKLLEGPVKLKATRRGQKLLDHPSLTQVEAHQWYVAKTPKGFEVLADSDYGIEIIRRKNLLATQFHPELGGTLNLSQLIKHSYSG